MMKRLLLLASLSLTLMLCGGSALAQRRGQRRARRSPNKSVVLVARVDAEFDTEDGGFTAHFPNVPMRNVSKSEAGSDALDNIEYSVSDGDVSYMVSFADHNVAITDTAQLKSSYDLMSQSMRGNDVFKMVSERDVSLDGRPGREYVFELQGYVHWLRRFIVNQRDYKVMFYAKNTGKDAAPIIRQWGQKANAFLNSFKITKVPAPVVVVSRTAAPSLPANFWGKVSDETYTNEFFGLSLSIPAGWYVLSESDEKIVTYRGREMVKEVTKSETAAQGMITLLGLTKFPAGTPRNPSLMVVTEKLPSNAITAEQVARAGQQLMTKGMPYVKQYELHLIKIGGVDFATFNTEVKKDDLVAKQKIYIMTRNGFGLTIAMTYLDDNDMTALDGIIQSLQFK